MFFLKSSKIDRNSDQGEIIDWFNFIYFFYTVEHKRKKIIVYVLSISIIDGGAHSYTDRDN